MKEPEEKLEHGFFVRNGGIISQERAKKKGPAKFTNPFDISETYRNSISRHLNGAHAAVSGSADG